MAKLDFSKFKKVRQDKDYTIMRHPAGHEIRIAHSALSPHMKSQLDNIPNYSKNVPHLDEGGYIPGVGKKSDVEAFQSGLAGKKKESKSYGKMGDAESAAESAEKNTPKPASLSYLDEDVKLANGGQVADKGPYLDPEKAKAFSAGLAGKTAPKQSGVQTFQTYGSAMSPEDAAEAAEKNTPKPKSLQYLEEDVKLADGGDVNSSSMQDSPEQIAADAAAPQTQQVPQIDPELQAKRSLYNQQVQSMSNIPGDPDEQQRIKATQFGPNGEAPANFNIDAWNKASTDYGASQQAETAQKQQQTAQIAAQNQARIAAGLPPIPVTADQAASEIPPQSNTPVPATSQRLADPAIPGDNELKQLQSSQQAIKSSNPTASPVDTEQKLVAAKQLTYDALMHERQQMLAQMTDVKPETMGSLFHDKNLPGKLGMLAGMMLGGGAAGTLGGPNQVAQMYENMIDRDLKSQQLNLSKKQGLLANNLALMGNIPDAVKLSKVQMMDKQMHTLVQLAQKYPNNPQIQQNLQAMGMMGAQSSSNLMDSIAANQAWRHAASEIKDPAQKIQFHPMLTPEQKNSALKELGTYQNMNAMRSNILDAFDKVSKMSLAGTFNPNQRNALLQPLLAQAVKDSEGRITPQDVPMIEALLPSRTDAGRTRDIKRAQLAKFMSSKMNFPMLSLAGVDVNTPSIGNIQSGPPKLGK